MARDAPYFVDQHGTAWTPIGQNDAIPWTEFSGLIRRRDPQAVERHLGRLRAHGVTCLRLMLEYCEDETCHLENPAGAFRPEMVRLWDDLIALCERYRLYLLLTPFDTFFIWNNWDAHPYSRANGGPCADRTRLLTCPETRALIKARLAFATRRWGGSGSSSPGICGTRCTRCRARTGPAFSRISSRMSARSCATWRSGCTDAHICRPSRCSGRS